ncbi:MAG TPA: type II toxin-antitoxin system VapC family toxin [Thauera aminoaromatica]|nr:type II toxin-antitoxin system VapC family toxin [Thauera aminoaromatica]
MIGLDTNVLVRYIVRDDPAQTALADHCIDHRCSREQPGYVSHLVMAELCWVLERGYGYPRQILGEVLGTLLTSEEIKIQDAPRVRLALGAFSAGAVDFADCLIGLLHQRAECETTVTFDKKAARLPTHRLLE